MQPSISSQYLRILHLFILPLIISYSGQLEILTQELFKHSYFKHNESYLQLFIFVIYYAISIIIDFFKE